MWNGQNSNTPDNRMPGIRRARIATNGMPIVEEESIREIPIYKILKFAEAKERWKTREPY